MNNKIGTNYLFSATRLVTVVLLVCSLVLHPVSVVAVVSAAAPLPPTAPSAPTPGTEEPEEPDAPEAPDSPDAPEAPDRDGYLAAREERRAQEELEEAEEEEREQEERDAERAAATAPSTVTTESTPLSAASVPQNTLGGTVQDGELGDVSIDTGDAGHDTFLVNAGNLNTDEAPDAASSCCGVSGGISAGNVGNGAGSTNDIGVGVSQEDVLVQENRANVDNDLDQDVRTGANRASNNTGGNSLVETGDADSSATIVNMLNTNAAGVKVAQFTVSDDHVGDYVLDFDTNCVSGCGSTGSASLGNEGNGSDSLNTIGYESDNNSATFQTNDADIVNTLTLAADSGNNDASRNTGGDVSIRTGDASVTANILNFANNNIAGNVVVGLVNIYGNFLGDIVLPAGYFTQAETESYFLNEGNGSGSSNSLAFSQVDDSSIFQFNDALIQNDVNIDVNTGGNTANRNTGGDVLVDTGDASATANVLNVANTNLVGGDWWLVLVNEAGKWIGKILGSPEGANFAGSAGTQFEAGDSGEITAVNTKNGAGSDNSIDYSETTTETIVQDNDATIQNTLNLSANTGDNTASDNTGGNTRVRTGDADVVANIINFVNNNIVGSGRLFVTMVNVFGSWVGDFVTPGHEKEKAQAAALGAPVGGIAADEGGEKDENAAHSSASEEEEPALPGSTRLAWAGPDAGDNDDEPSSIPSVVQHGSTSGGTAGSVLGSTQNSVPSTLLADSSVNPSQLVEGLLAEQGNESGPRKVQVNLAWGLLLLPLLVIYRRRALLIRLATGVWV